MKNTITTAAANKLESLLDEAGVTHEYVSIDVQKFGVRTHDVEKAKAFFTAMGATEIKTIKTEGGFVICGTI